MKSLLVAALSFGASMSALAGGDLRFAPSAALQSECGSCHIVYPPRGLPAESWGRLVSGLARHFGTDASLEPAVEREIGEYLAMHAGKRDAPTGPEPRITATRWFAKEHRKVSAATWTGAAVKSPANCPACHADAAAGDFRERGVRTPR